MLWKLQILRLWISKTYALDMTKRFIPSLNWLRTFEAAARTESFARAAEILNMSWPAVSQQIRSLEEALGKPLFVRGPRHVALTREGLAFLPVVNQSLAAVETTAMALFRPAEEQHVTVQVVGLLAMGWLPGHLPVFEERHPGVRTHILTATSPAEFQALPAGREPDVQIAFGSASDFPDSAIRLFGEELSVVAHADLAATISAPSDLRGVRLYDAVPHQSGWHQILNTPEASGVEDVEFVMVDNTPTALMMAAAGHGLALARSPASDGLVESLGLKPCRGLPVVRGVQHYYLVIPETKRLSPAASAFRDWMLDLAQDRP